MIYKFVIGSEESENFKLEIAIDAEDTFVRLRNAILEAAGYDKEQMDSFYICDDEWTKEKEVTYADMGLDDSDEDVWIMEDTRLDELIEDEGQKLKFVFDYMTERSFFMKLKVRHPRNLSIWTPLLRRYLKSPMPQTSKNWMPSFMATRNLMRKKWRTSAK